MRRYGRMSALLLVSPLVVVGHSLRAQSPSPAWLVGLHLVSDAGPITVSYSPTDSIRARQIRALTEPMLAFYKARLAVTVNVGLAVIDSATWARIPALAPFPVPFITDGVAVLATSPLSADEARGLRGVTLAPPMPAAAAASVTSLGRNPERMIDLVVLGRDGLVVHELGHAFTSQYGIATPRRWISEFLADYWQQAFLIGAFPALTQFSDAMASASQGPPKPVTYTTLADFDRLSGPPSIPVLNYEWYQDTFTQRVRQVYALRGLEFLTQMRAAFPRAETARLDDEEIIKRFESISPGWREWITTFGASRR